MSARGLGSWITTAWKFPNCVCDGTLVKVWGSPEQWQIFTRPYCANCSYMCDETVETNDGLPAG